MEMPRRVARTGRSSGGYAVGTPFSGNTQGRVTRRDALQCGFTLLEVLVAVVILGIVLTAVYAAYTSNLETIQAARDYGEVNQIGRIVLDRMAKDLESAFVESPLTGPEIKLGFIGETRDVDGNPADRIDFTTLTHLDVAGTGLETDLCEIGYYLEEDPDKETYNLYRRDDPTPDDDLTAGGHAMVLASNVVGLRFTYENAKGEVSEGWDTLSEETGRRLPSLVTIELQIQDERGARHVYKTSVHPALSGGKAPN
jgi:prepilin-type N-terminal cleavage/methylation domain-containing protein